MRARLKQMIDGAYHAQVIRVAAEFHLADHLAEGPASSAALASAAGADPEAMYRLLRACAAIGLVAEVAPRMFALLPLGAPLQAGAPGSIRNYAIAATTPARWLPWSRLDHAVKRGTSVFEDIFGEDVWEYYAHHQEGEHFGHALRSLAARIADEVATTYDPSPFTRIVELGGRHGLLLDALLRAAPAAHGVNLDRPDVIQELFASMEALDAADRIELVAGDFFDDVPQSGDLYVLMQILHDWDDERCTRILSNIRRAAAPRHALLIVEQLPADATDPALVAIADLTMLLLHGGRERRLEDFTALLGPLGYTVRRVQPLSLPLTLIEAIHV